MNKINLRSGGSRGVVVVSLVSQAHDAGSIPASALALYIFSLLFFFSKKVFLPDLYRWKRSSGCRINSHCVNVNSYFHHNVKGEELLHALM